MRTSGSRLALTAVALLLGFLVVIQLRAQGGGSGLENQSAQELTLVVANLSTRNDQLRQEVADLERQLDARLAEQARGGTSAGAIRSDIERIEAWSGAIGVTGPGVRVTLRGDVPGTAVGDLINELRNAGSEAIAVGGVRVTAGTVVAGLPGELSVENTALPPTLVVEAIGNAATLTGTLARAGGVIAQLQATYDGLSVEVTPIDRLILAASERDLAPREARPKL